MKPRLRWLWPALATAALAVAAVAYGAWTALSLRSHLEAANAEAHSLRAAVVAQDRAAAQHSFDAMARDFRVASDRASSPAWWTAEHLPVLGDDARAVGTFADVGAHVAGGPLRQFLTTGDWDLLERLTPHHGRVDLHAVQELAPGVHQLATSLEHGSRQLHAVDARHLTGPVAPSFTAARSQLAEVAGILGSADRALRVLPAMLGADGPRTYLLALGNNAEIRATGGIPSALALLRADDGRITVTRQASSSNFPVFKQPVLPQPAAERAIYDRQPAVYLQDTNFMPEFPRTAALLRAMWAERYGQQVDGVISIDAVTLSYLLRATGAVTMNGVTLTDQNATSELLHDVYMRLPDNAEQDAFFRAVARTVFTRVTGGVAAPRLLQAVAQSVREGRAYVHSFDPAVQRVLDPTPLAGQLPVSGRARRDLGVFLDDATGAKMSYYLRTHLTVRRQGCAAGDHTFQALLTLRSTAPEDASRLPKSITGGGAFGTAPGHLLVLAHVYGPSGGSMQRFTFDGHGAQVPSVRDRGRPVATTVVDLAPGQTTTMRWQIRQGKGPVWPSIQLAQGPTLQSRPATALVPLSCR